jgi:hypothetical protein
MLKMFLNWDLPVIARWPKGFRYQAGGARELNSETRTRRLE